MVLEEILVPRERSKGKSLIKHDSISNLMGMLPVRIVEIVWSRITIITPNLERRRIHTE